MALNEYKAKLDKHLEGVAVLQLAEQKTGVPRVYLVLGGVGVLFLSVLLGVLDSLLTNLVGFLYPAYASFKGKERTCLDEQQHSFMLCGTQSN